MRGSPASRRARGLCSQPVRASWKAVAAGASAARRRSAGEGTRGHQRRHPKIATVPDANWPSRNTGQCTNLPLGQGGGGFRVVGSRRRKTGLLSQVRQCQWLFRSPRRRLDRSRLAARRTRPRRLRRRLRRRLCCCRRGPERLAGGTGGCGERSTRRREIGRSGGLTVRCARQGGGRSRPRERQARPKPASAVGGQRRAKGQPPHAQPELLLAGGAGTRIATGVPARADRLRLRPHQSPHSSRPARPDAVEPCRNSWSCCLGRQRRAMAIGDVRGARAWRRGRGGFTRARTTTSHRRGPRRRERPCVQLSIPAGQRRAGRVASARANAASHVPG